MVKDALQRDMVVPMGVVFAVLGLSLTVTGLMLGLRAQDLDSINADLDHIMAASVEDKQDVVAELRRTEDRLACQMEQMESRLGKRLDSLDQQIASGRQVNTRPYDAPIAAGIAARISGAPGAE